MGSSRFPGKPLANILGIPMIGHVIKRATMEKIFDKVVVATCDKEIAAYAESIGMEAVMTSSSHERASDRVCEALQTLETKDGVSYESITLLQGDEPLVTPRMLRSAINALNDSAVSVVNLRSLITNREEFLSINCVKVVCNEKSDALYFSRAPIPRPNKLEFDLPKAYKQVCIIPFRRDFLMKYSDLAPTYLESVESVDMNRVLESGFNVRCVLVDEESYPVDVPEDIVRVEHIMQKCPLFAQYRGERV
jgi:3-deoxy-manno-octulosonate cytidylyltransferase (CMP-KDO synthetase)